MLAHLHATACMHLPCSSRTSSVIVASVCAVCAPRVRFCARGGAHLIQCVMSFRATASPSKCAPHSAETRTRMRTVRIQTHPMLHIMYMYITSTREYSVQYKSNAPRVHARRACATSANREFPTTYQLLAGRLMVDAMPRRISAPPQRARARAHSRSVRARARVVCCAVLCSILAA